MTIAMTPEDQATLGALINTPLRVLCRRMDVSARQAKALQQYVILFTSCAHKAALGQPYSDLEAKARTVFRSLPKAVQVEILKLCP